MPQAAYRRARKKRATPAQRRAPWCLRWIVLGVEELESRVLLSGGASIASAIRLSFADTSTPFQTARATEYLANPGDVELNQIALNAGDVVTASINSAPYGGGLQSFLRVFQDLGGDNVRQIASNLHFLGQDPGLTFQAPATGNYYLGVSSFDNTTYNPLVAAGGSGSSHGLFDLNLSKSRTATPPGLEGSSFQITQATAVWGDAVNVSYTIQNRGAQDAAAGTVSLLISTDNHFDDAIPALQSASIPALAAGDSYSGSFTVNLGKPAGIQDGQQVFLGLQIGSALPGSAEQGNDWAPLQVLASAAAKSDGSISTRVGAQKIVLNSRTHDIAFSPTSEAFFKIKVTQPGNLTAQVDAAGSPTSLTLYDSKGIPIVQSDGQSAADASPLLTHGLTGSAGSPICYYLKVANLGQDSAICNLTTLFTPSASTLQTVPLGSRAELIATGDFNGDGRSDVAVVTVGSISVAVLLGNGDGTFQNAGSFDAGIPMDTMVTADLRGDGRLDLVVANNGTNDGVAVLLGNGDGTFQPPQVLGVAGGTASVVGDFNGDGNLDLAFANPENSTVNVLLGDGKGTFQSAPPIAVPGGPDALVTGDFNGDGRLDLATADESSNQVTVLLGNGDGRFLIGGSFDVGMSPRALVEGDFTGDMKGDGHLDLATANYLSKNVTVLIGDGHGSFQTGETCAVANAPNSLVTGDFNGDGRLDLATVSPLSNDVTVLLGQENGSFQNAGSFASGSGSKTLVAAAFTGGSAVDLVVANGGSQDVEVLRANGDGTFKQTGASNSSGNDPVATVSGDFNGDGRIDLAVANANSNNVTVLLGQGDGTFQSAGTYGAEHGIGSQPSALVVGDFNGDGRLDLAVANYASNNVTVLLGKGDGTFQEADVYRVPGRPPALVAGDFNGDGALDLAVAIKENANYSFASSVEILLGDGHGNFHVGGLVATGTAPDALVVGDFNGDGHLDLATANFYSEDVTVLLGDGHGSFPNAQSYPIVADTKDQGQYVRPAALVTGDFNGDTHLDLAVASQSYYYSDVTVLLSDGHGAFHSNAPITLTTRVSSLVPGDFNGDGNFDLAAVGPVYAYYSTPVDMAVLLGYGEGDFQNPASIPVGNQPFALVAGDFNGDGRVDVAVTDLGSATVTTMLGTGTGTFVPAALAPIPVRSTPLVVNFTGEPDAVVLNQAGQILVRQGLANEPGAFAPPVVLNPDPRLAAHDLALVQNASGWTFLAALDAKTSAVTLYTTRPDGTFSAQTLAGLNLPAGFLPADIASADLTGDGLGDLVITAAASDQVFVSLQTANGDFSRATAYAVGVNPSAIDLVSVSGGKLPDIVVTDQFSGQVSVLRNQGNGVFDQEQRFRAGTGLYGMATVNGTDSVQALEQTNGVVAGSFEGGTGTDLAVINSGADSFTVLQGDGFGGFLNPQPGKTFFTGSPPTAIVAGHFITGDGYLDLGILSEDSGTISIYRGDGEGRFTLVSTLSAGNQPTGLVVADVTSPGGGGPDGVADLLVGNAYGDLLILAGHGDGTFSQYRRVDQNVTLAVAISPTTGKETFFFSDQGSDQLAYKPAAPGTTTVANPTVYQDRGAGIQAPGPEAIVTVGGTQYLVVVNSGANDLLIYTLDPDGEPILLSKQTYFTGTDPVSLTVTNPGNDLNGDSIPDLVVANAGSNDVSVFLGQESGNALTGFSWTLSYRPRQSSGGMGPTSVAIVDVPGASGPDLAVSNGQSNDVALLAGRGNGFFVNQSTLPLNPGSDPQQVLVGKFDTTNGLDLVTINAGSNSVTLIANFLTNPDESTVSSGGTLPVAAVAVDLSGIRALLVANAGDGVLGFLQVGQNGSEEIQTAVQAVLPNLSGLALVAAGNELEVYGTAAGREVAELLATFGPSTSLGLFLPPSPGIEGGLEIGSNTVIPDTTAASSLNVVPVAEKTVTGEAFLPVFVSFSTPGDLDEESSAAGDIDRTLTPANAGTGPGAHGLGGGGNPPQILLLNLIDYTDNGDGQNRQDDQDGSDQSLGDLVPRNLISFPGEEDAVRGPFDPARAETRAPAVPALDRIWEEVGKASSTIVPTPQALQGTGRTAPGEGRLGQRPGAPLVLTREECGQPTLSGPGESQKHLVESKETAWRDTGVAIASLCSMLPLLVSRVLKPLRRRCDRMGSLVRIFWN